MGKETLQSLKVNGGSWESQHTMYDAKCLELDKAKAKIKQLKFELADIKASWRVEMNTPCDDEKHCTCVPALRQRNKQLEAEKDQWEKRFYRLTHLVEYKEWQRILEEI